MKNTASVSGQTQFLPSDTDINFHPHATCAKFHITICLLLAGFWTHVAVVPMFCSGTRFRATVPRLAVGPRRIIPKVSRMQVRLYVVN